MIGYNVVHENNLSPQSWNVLVECAQGFKGVVVMSSCGLVPTHYTVSGCETRTCTRPTLPASLAGYVINSEVTFEYYNFTVEISCVKPGYDGKNVSAICPGNVDNEPYTLNNCAPVMCGRPPNVTDLGYVISAEPDLAYANFSGVTATCSYGYYQTSTIGANNCDGLNEGAPYIPYGCTAALCVRPATGIAEYSFDAETDLRSRHLDVTVTCVFGYHGNVIITDCGSTTGTPYGVNGCTISHCVRPNGAALANYTVVSEPNLQLLALSVVLQCATGYGGAPLATACTSDALPYILSGCIAIHCKRPAALSSEYLIVSEANLKLSHFAVTVGCNAGYFGVAVAGDCSGDPNSYYSISGICNHVTCTTPGALPHDVVVIVEKNTTSVGFSVETKCAPGYSGTATAQDCGVHNTDWVLNHNCVETVCTRPPAAVLLSKGYRVLSETNLTSVPSKFAVKVECDSRYFIYDSTSAAHVGPVTAAPCVDGGATTDYTITGGPCTPFYCTRPTHDFSGMFKLEGYDFIVETDLRAAFLNVNVVCSEGFGGILTVEPCTENPNGPYAVSGCTYGGTADVTTSTPGPWIPPVADPVPTAPLVENHAVSGGIYLQIVNSGVLNETCFLDEVADPAFFDRSFDKDSAVSMCVAFMEMITISLCEGLQSYSTDIGCNDLNVKRISIAKPGASDLAYVGGTAADDGASSSGASGGGGATAAAPAAAGAAGSGNVTAAVAPATGSGGAVAPAPAGGGGAAAAAPAASASALPSNAGKNVTTITFSGLVGGSGGGGGGASRRGLRSLLRSLQSGGSSTDKNDYFVDYEVRFSATEFYKDFQAGFNPDQPQDKAMKVGYRLSKDPEGLENQVLNALDINLQGKDWAGLGTDYTARVNDVWHKQRGKWEVYEVTTGSATSASVPTAPGVTVAPGGASAYKTKMEYQLGGGSRCAMGGPAIGTVNADDGTIWTCEGWVQIEDTGPPPVVNGVELGKKDPNNAKATWNGQAFVEAGQVDPTTGRVWDGERYIDPDSTSTKAPEKKEDCSNKSVFTHYTKTEDKLQFVCLFNGAEMPVLHFYLLLVFLLCVVCCGCMFCYLLLTNKKKKKKKKSSEDEIKPIKPSYNTQVDVGDDIPPAKPTSDVDLTDEKDPTESHRHSKTALLNNASGRGQDVEEEDDDEEDEEEEESESDSAVYKKPEVVDGQLPKRKVKNQFKGRQGESMKRNRYYVNKNQALLEQPVDTEGYKQAFGGIDKQSEKKRPGPPPPPASKAASNKAPKAPVGKRGNEDEGEEVQEGAAEKTLRRKGSKSKEGGEERKSSKGTKKSLKSKMQTVRDQIEVDYADKMMKNRFGAPKNAPPPPMGVSPQSSNQGSPRQPGALPNKDEYAASRMPIGLTGPPLMSKQNLTTPDRRGSAGARGPPGAPPSKKPQTSNQLSLSSPRGMVVPTASTRSNLSSRSNAEDVERKKELVNQKLAEIDMRAEEFKNELQDFDVEMFGDDPDMVDKVSEAVKEAKAQLRWVSKSVASAQTDGSKFNFGIEQATKLETKLNGVMGDFERKCERIARGGK